MKELAVTVYHNDIIVLDINNDEFYIIERVNPLAAINKNDISECIECFGDYNLIYLNLTDAFFYPLDGYLEERWKPKVTDFKPNNKMSCCLELIKASIKLMNISRNIIKRKWVFILKNKLVVSRKQMDKTEQSARVNLCLWKLINTFYLNFNKTDCLTTSVVLQHFLAEMGISSNLVVGVRTKPFFSHAWLEVDGEIINDYNNLRQCLSVIIEIKS